MNQRRSMPSHVCGVVLLEQVKLQLCFDRLSATRLIAGNLGEPMATTML